jgi:competence protein ComFB
VELINQTLHSVWQTLEEVLVQRPEVCQCEKCRYDMVCLALNNLKPRYYVSRHGAIYAKLNALSQQSRTDVLTEVARAVEKVSKNPHHLG